MSRIPTLPTSFQPTQVTLGMTGAIRPYLDFLLKTGEARKEREFRSGLLESQMDARRNATRTAMVAEATNQAIQTAMAPLLEKSQFEFRQTIRDKARAKQLAEMESVVEQREDLTDTQKDSLKVQLLRERMGLRGRLMPRDEPWPVGRGPGEIWTDEHTGLVLTRDPSDGKIRSLSGGDSGLSDLKKMLFETALERAYTTPKDPTTGQPMTDEFGYPLPPEFDMDRALQLYEQALKKFLMNAYTPGLDPPAGGSVDRETAQHLQQQRGEQQYNQQSGSDPPQPAPGEGQVDQAGQPKPEGVWEKIKGLYGDVTREAVMPPAKAGQATADLDNRKLIPLPDDGRPPFTKEERRRRMEMMEAQRTGRATISPTEAFRQYGAYATDPVPDRPPFTKKQQRKAQAPQIDQEVHTLIPQRYQETLKSAQVFTEESVPMPGQYYKSGAGNLFIANEDGVLIPVQPGAAP